LNSHHIKISNLTAATLRRLKKEGLEVEEERKKRVKGQNKNTVELGYNVMKEPEYFVSL
jgi:hypothetical protein